MLCSPTQTCFWAGRLTPAIRAIRRSPNWFDCPDTVKQARIRQSEQEIVTGSRVIRKPLDGLSAGSGMGSVPMLRRRAAAVPGREIPAPAAPPTQREPATAHPCARSPPGSTIRIRARCPGIRAAPRGAASGRSRFVILPSVAPQRWLSDRPARPSRAGRSRGERDGVALATPRSPLEVGLLEQAFVLVRHQVRLDLGNE